MVVVADPQSSISPESDDCSSPYTQRNIHLNQGAGYLGQKTPYYCGPHCLMQCIYDLTGIDMSEQTLAGWAGTTTGGTGHDGLATALAKFNQQYNQNLKMEWYNHSELDFAKEYCMMDKENIAVFYHLLYRRGTTNEAGHYEMAYQGFDNSTNMKIANSLGNKQGNGYYGYIESRDESTQKYYIGGIGQKSVCVITKQ